MMLDLEPKRNPGAACSMFVSEPGASAISHASSSAASAEPSNPFWRGMNSSSSALAYSS
jgi:hypothetical protein